MVVFTFFGIAILWDWNENRPFPVLWPLLSFPNVLCWHIECSTFTASSFRIWNSSAGIPSPPLALFVVRLPKTHLTSESRMSGSRWVTTPLWLSGLLRPFLYSSSIRLHQPNTFLNPCRGLHHDIPSSLCDFIPYNATCTRFQPEGLPCGTTLLPASGLTVPFALDAVSPVCMAPFSFHPSSAQTSHHYSWSILCPSNIEQHPPCITCLLTVGKCANRTREGDRQVGDGVRVNINTSL